MRAGVQLMSHALSRFPFPVESNDADCCKYQTKESSPGLLTRPRRLRFQTKATIMYVLTLQVLVVLNSVALLRTYGLPRRQQPPSSSSTHRLKCRPANANGTK